MIKKFSPVFDDDERGIMILVAIAAVVNAFFPLLISSILITGIILLMYAEIELSFRVRRGTIENNREKLNKELAKMREEEDRKCQR